jgi:hypothetical protein
MAFSTFVLFSAFSQRQSCSQQQAVDFEELLCDGIIWLNKSIIQFNSLIYFELKCIEFRNLFGKSITVETKVFNENINLL